MLILTGNIKIKAKDFSHTTFQLTSALLQQNPEYYTIWNYRRILLLDVFERELNPTASASPLPEDTVAANNDNLTPAQREISLLIKEDLHFLIPLLKQYPKCYWIWNHRSWLLATATEHLPATQSAELWQGELSLVSKMLALDSRNFHGWSYRREVVGELERLGNEGKSMSEEEFEYTTKMIKTNLSNFSAWHNRSQLIPRILEERAAGTVERREFFDQEFELITRALYTDPYDQSLWFYHQYLMSILDPSSPTNSSTYARNNAILSPVTNADRLHYLEQELDSIREMLDGAEDCKYIYQALLDYSGRYLEVDAGNKKITTQEMSGWLEELRRLDPLREGRWRDLGVRMKL